MIRKPTSIGLRAAHCWYMPHEVPGFFNKLLHHCQGFGQEDIEQATEAVSRVPLGSAWFRPEGVAATSSVGSDLEWDQGRWAHSGRKCIKE